MYLESMHRLLLAFARSPPGTTAAGSLQIPSYVHRHVMNHERVNT